jgi:uncharacterized membrane protein
MNEDLQLILDMLPFLVPLILLEIGLMVAALINVIKRERVRGDNKVIWILIIVLFQLIGPIVYFIAGRKEDYVDGNQD